MSLRVHVHELTSTHKRTGPGGKLYDIPALLDQLADELSPSHTGRAGGGGVSLPYAEAVSRLMATITEQARTEQIEMDRDATGETKAIIASWADVEGEWQGYLEHVTMEWIDAINDVIYPERVRRMPVPCPACGQLFTANDGERAYSVTLHAWDRWTGGELKYTDWWAECVGCGAEWRDAEGMKFLVHAISAA
jgi:hypothetical protein